MSIDQIIAAVRNLEGSLVVTPGPRDVEVPEIAWGDSFFSYAPDGTIPQNTQPYATVVTKNYPDDTASDLDAEGRWRVNIQVDRATFRELTGEEPRGLALARDFSAADVVLPHPVYGSLSWVSVVNPGDRCGELVLRLLRDAHDAARTRYERRRA
ncbi:DUF6194 family protein [Antribacter gilvus]|uniref:DUF6194 family protein n=1 Tax=Antribacter gilvus TaxID=2304675 RepID=UPI000F77BC07|nr:DUF6194 family protein [Antribacter gilvus]